MYNYPDDENVEMELDDDSPSAQAQPVSSTDPQHHNTGQTGPRYMFEVSSDPRQNDDRSGRKTKADPAIFVLIDSSVVDTLPLLYHDQAAPINLMLSGRFEITENRYHFKLEEASSVSFLILKDILCSEEEEREMTDVPVEELYYFALFTTKYNINHQSEAFRNWLTAWYIKNIDLADNASKLPNLLFPCMFYNHPQAFYDISKEVVLSANDRIANYNPLRNNSVFLSPTVIRKSSSSCLLG